MRKLVLLGGNYIGNKEWLEKIVNQFKDSFDETYIQIYKHRKGVSVSMDFDYELEVLCQSIHQYEDIVIFGKSFGVILALMAVATRGIKPSKCIFLGVPMGYIQSSNFPLHEYLSQIACPVLFIQKIGDPACCYNDLVADIGNISDKFIFKEMDGNDHDYAEINQLKIIILNFLKNQNE